MDSDWALVIATFALIGVTLWYATETRSMASAMRRQTEELLAPRVSVRVERRDGRVWLVVENTGEVGADHLSLATEAEIPTMDRGWMQPLAMHDIFNPNAATYLAPRSRRELVIGPEKWILEQRNYYLPRFTVKVSYGRPGRASIEEEIPIVVMSLFTVGELRHPDEPDREWTAEG